MEIFLGPDQPAIRTVISVATVLRHPTLTDNQLFDEIVAMTYPEVGDFIKTYVQGDTPIPYKSFLEKAGVTISNSDKKLQSIIMLDSRTPFIGSKPNEAGVPELVVNGVNNRLKAIGFQEGDVLRVFNGTEIPELNSANAGMVNQLFGASFSWTPDQEVTFEVDRDGEHLTLSGTVGIAVAPAKGIAAMDDATPAQIALRNAWLYE